MQDARSGTQGPDQPQGPGSAHQADEGHDDQDQIEPMPAQVAGAVGTDDERRQQRDGKDGPDDPVRFTEDPRQRRRELDQEGRQEQRHQQQGQYRKGVVGRALEARRPVGPGPGQPRFGRIGQLGSKWSVRCRE